MFTSLRSRLWLTYALLISLILCVVGTAIIVVVLRGNIPIQQAALRLQALRANTLPLLRSAGERSPRLLQALLIQNADQISGRIVVLSNQGEVLADSLGEGGENLPGFSDKPLKTEIGVLPNFYRDGQGRGWYYIIDEINPKQLAFFAVRRPPLQILAVLRDQYLGPLVQAGIIALLASVIFSLLLSRWISAPLQRISQEAQQVALGRAHKIPLDGPDEVKQLARAFNNMTRQVKDTQQSQKDFVANVSHELRTPLTSIQGFARAILDGTVKNEEELNRAAEIIEGEAVRMDRLVTDLLTLAKMDTGLTSFKLEEVNLKELLEIISQKFFPRIKEAGLDFQLEYHADEIRVQGDPDRLMQVFDNLLANAIRFTPRGGHVTCYSQVVKNAVEIHFIDTGQGIPESEQKRIFERFYQVDKSRTRGTTRGYGLGLAISKQIVEAHNGSLTFTSKTGEGSHFVVKLPHQT